ncbi:hypothetical protein V6N13_115688 [Hibiscus sabdariffa]
MTLLIAMNHWSKIESIIDLEVGKSIFPIYIVETPAPAVNLDGRQFKVQGFCSSESSSLELSPIAVENSVSAEKYGTLILGAEKFLIQINWEKQR